MNVVKDTTSILSQVTAAIKSAENNGEIIKQIELTEAEMKSFLAEPQFKSYIDKHYASYERPVPLDIAKVKKDGDVPSSCWYLGVKIVKV